MEEVNQKVITMPRNELVDKLFPKLGGTLISIDMDDDDEDDEPVVTFVIQED